MESNDSLHRIKRYLKEYDGPDMNIMEVCGSHTGAIAKLGIPSVISKKIHLISGPGCPVCVTPSSYIDKLIELSKIPGNVIVSFGDLIRVPGSMHSLSDMKGRGADIRMVYSPADTIEIAVKEPDKNFIFAAIGFETTTPVYALVVKEIIEGGLKNIKILTALKTMPAVIKKMMDDGASVDAFIAPGHVSAITGYRVYEPLAAKYGIPFGVAGFKGNELLAAICGIVMKRGCGSVMNYYPAVVTPDGNKKAQELVSHYFMPVDAVWRGLGPVPDSGMILRPEFSFLDAGSSGLDEDIKMNRACSCDKVLTGRFKPYECPLFGTACTPQTPQGACMVSLEGSCYSYYVNKRID